ncbi:MAG: hypothetical protein Q7J60_15515 [Bradyrhizobium sp.]|uniref:hypothetical protein n=1 Tax=Bradyrhizobium sp. TaxID=376 RepID=UPI0027207AC9|nr:hypothetical protein [Bradyrhizobium sp.]MDO9563022.1 hypothetical protein [Bradyrhizobium sp.]MDP3690001.1 hypothetical protein [Bradyrhizobium sp.]
MSRFSVTRFACIAATVLFSSGAILTPITAGAAPVSAADKAAVKQAIVACKAEAKGKKVKWLSRRKYVNQCVAEGLKGRPNIDVNQMLKDHPDMKDLPKEQFDAT